MIRAFFKFLFCPPSRMRGCTPKTEAQRVADYERRMGEYRAQQRLREEHAAQMIDQYTARTVRPKIRPLLPQ